MKKLRALVAILICALLASCGPREAPKEPETDAAAALLSEAALAAAEAGSGTQRVQGSVGLLRAAEGVSLSLRLELDLDSESVREPLGIHAVGTAGMAVLGTDSELPLELYAVEEDGELCAYLRLGEAWTVSRTAKGAEAASELWALGENPVLSAGSETVQGRAARRIDMTLSGDALRRTALRLPGNDGDAWADARLDVTLWVDEETHLPLRQSLKLVSPLRYESLTVQNLELVIDYTGFGGAAAITVPEDVKAAAQPGGVG